MPNGVKTRLRRYVLYFLGWTFLALFLFSESLTQKFYFHDPTPWWHSFASWLSGIYICAFLTPGILWLGRRFPIERANWLGRTALHLIFSVGFSLIDLALASIVSARMGILPMGAGKSFRTAFTILLVISFHGSILTYWAILCVQYAIRYYRGYQERELHASELKAQLARAQLSALKMQLQPHFLFNTLNAIMVLVRQQRGRQAEETLARLSDLLRCVLEDVEAQEVPLRRELEYLQLYLSIEQVRFQDRLRVEIFADPAILDAAVPHMGLQPIVENAIRHGIGRSSAAGRIQISARHMDDTLELTVRDDGPGLPAANSSQGHGIGLANTRARLHRLYGDAARLTVENGERGGAVATMVLPWHLAPEISEMEVMELHALDHAGR